MPLYRMHPLPSYFSIYRFSFISMPHAVVPLCCVRMAPHARVLALFLVHIATAPLTAISAFILRTYCAFFFYILPIYVRFYRTLFTVLKHLCT
jgi:hypothetical protein